MNRILSTILISLLCLCGAMAQPAAVKNVAKSVFALKAYDAEGKQIATSNGVFLSADGIAACPWSAVREASRVEIVDFNGKTYPVTHILGANELYDVCRVRVDMPKTVAATIATAAAAKDSKLWLVETADRRTQTTQYEVDKAETFMEKYAYYVFGYNNHKPTQGAAFVNEKGQVVGLMQQSVRSLYANAVDVRFISTLAASHLDINNSLYAKTSLRLTLPADKQNALLMVMLAAERQDTAKYAGYLSDYIRQFPKEVDGYATSALQKSTYGDWQGADADMQTALKLAADKAEAHSEYARVMYQKLIYSADTTFTVWTFERALAEAEKAYSLNPQPQYLHRMAQIKFSMGDYGDACEKFLSLAKKDMPTSEVYFEAAQCKTQLGAPKTEVLELLDSCVAVAPRPLTNLSAPYVLARGQLYEQMEEYRKAIVDYNTYDTLVYGRANAAFYYARHKCEVAVHQYKQALDDLAHAAYIGGADAPLYIAELASLQLRVNMNEEAVKTSDLCLQLTPDNTDAYIIKGLALVQLKRKNEAMECFNKAKELGDDRAEGYIKKYK